VTSTPTFAHVIARNNPFRVDRTDAVRFRFAQGTWDEHVGRLAALRYRAAIIGPQGSGKTTLLTDLAERLRRRNLFVIANRASVDRRTNRTLVISLLARARPGCIILLDSAEQLSRPDWWKLIQQSNGRCGLVVAVHRHCSLPTWIRCTTSIELMQMLLEDLGLTLNEAAILNAAKKSFRAHHGNIRDVFRGLYDDIAEGRLRPGS
jgi:hypothetical protein